MIDEGEIIEYKEIIDIFSLNKLSYRSCESILQGKWIIRDYDTLEMRLEELLEDNDEWFQHLDLHRKW